MDIYLLLSVRVVLFGIARQFGVALVAFWAATTLRHTNGPLYTAWLNRNIFRSPAWNDDSMLKSP